VSLETLITQVVTEINKVTDVGNVYNYERWAAFLSKALDIAKYTTSDGDSVIRFWTVTCAKTPQDWAPTKHNPGGIRGRLREYELVIRGVFGHSDASQSELDARPLVFSVMDIIDASTTIHSAQAFGADSTKILFAEPVQLFMFDTVLVQGAGMLCHYAELHLKAQETV